VKERGKRGKSGKGAQGPSEKHKNEVRGGRRVKIEGFKTSVYQCRFHEHPEN